MAEPETSGVTAAAPAYDKLGEKAPRDLTVSLSLSGEEDIPMPEENRHFRLTGLTVVVICLWAAIIAGACRRNTRRAIPTPTPAPASRPMLMHAPDAPPVMKAASAPTLPEVALSPTPVPTRKPRPKMAARGFAAMPAPVAETYYVPDYAAAQVRPMLLAKGVPADKITIVYKRAQAVPPPLQLASFGSATQAVPKSMTIGAGFPGIFEELWLRLGDQMGVLSAGREDSAYRTNVAATWTAGWVKTRIETYSASGRTIGTYDWDSRWVTSDPDGFVQFNGVAGAWNLAPRDADSPYFSTKIFVLEGPGKVCFYQTVIDNTSGDPVFNYSTRYAADGSVWGSQGMLSAPWPTPTPAPTPTPKPCPICPGASFPKAGL